MDIVDAHVHYWDPGRFAYPWIAADSAFDSVFTPELYAQATAAAPANALVFVECDADPRHSLDEARWVASLVTREPRLQAIVAHAGLHDPDVSHMLEALAAIPLVRGIRDNIQGQAPGFATAPAFVAGVRHAHRRGLHFELCCTQSQLGEVLALVEQCPDGLFILDHCGKPDIAGDGYTDWLPLLERLAAQPHVACKISGLLSEADLTRQPLSDVLRYAEAAARAFGPARILYGSDWPVVEPAGGPEAWLAVARALAAGWRESDRAAFFAGALLQRLAAVRGRLSLCADQAAAAKWWLSMPMASVSAEGPMPKALSTRRTSPLMPGCRHQGRACPLRRARMTSNPLIVA